MQSLKLDKDGDLVMENNDLQIVKDKDELVQTFRTVLRTNKNEWFLNPELGFDYAVILGVKEIEEEALRLALQDAAEQMDEIYNIDEIEINFDRRNRKVIISFIVTTVDGERLELEEVF